MPWRLALVGYALLATVAQAADTDAEILERYRDGRLFQRGSFAEVRAAFARRFEKIHADQIRHAYGPDLQGLTSWFAVHPTIKETFYTALDEKRDNVHKALGIFRDLWKRDPEQLAKWSELAIAVAVTWDNERAIYDYARHQTRVKSLPTGGEVGPLENYEWVIAHAGEMPQPVALYPWEFLVYVVNHRTPLAEREWALKYFQEIRGKSKSWHKDVPFDNNLVRLEQDNDTRAQPRLAGRPYTLENIRKFGGVCAHQTDFACRLAQCIGCPAAYCSGESAHRGSHAWWIYVNVSGTKADDLKFLFVTDGRTEGFTKDMFYTGLVIDPQTGERILDRDVERRLAVTSTDSVGKRLSQLIMQAYPIIAQELAFTPADRIAYLDKCLKVSRYNEDAWLQFAKLAKDGVLSGEHKRIAQARLGTLQATFKDYPDFVWRVLDDLTQVSATSAEKVKAFEPAVQLFEKLGRADLACAARLRMSQVQADDNKLQLAFNGLLLTIRRFPNEGRYIPRLLQEAELLAPKVNGVTQVASLYADLVPEMITYYKSETDEYCQKMEEQARQFMSQQNLGPALGQFDARVAKARAALRTRKAG